MGGGTVRAVGTGLFFTEEHEGKEGGRRGVAQMGRAEVWLCFLRCLCVKPALEGWGAGGDFSSDRDVLVTYLVDGLGMEGEGGLNGGVSADVDLITNISCYKFAHLSELKGLRAEVVGV
ncbi:MAG: hypothetical protein J6386_11205 [Candidatus Synoicihabitans palmerolidicus]|nr:hypothetical protein [Candidatus Synoicihabitans palmerolidicus]